ncbi:MAG: hypothetical protein KatS3mg077_2671 [Candidatus Binatia bacterium]|nr:MAG: hypothetical protein KatS3mg077_2671 [Candidatus Binatia bacterium]
MYGVGSGAQGVGVNVGVSVAVGVVEGPSEICSISASVQPPSPHHKFPVHTLIEFTVLGVSSQVVSQGRQQGFLGSLHEAK